MTHRILLASLMASAAILTGCSSSSSDGPSASAAPFADTYDRTLANETINAIVDALAKPGDTIQSAAGPVVGRFGENSETLTAGEVQPVEIERTMDGYILRFADEEVAFTDADLQDPGFYEQRVTNSNGQTRTLGALFSPDNFGPDGVPLPELLASEDRSMVPLGFFVRVNDDGPATGEPGSDDGNARGYTVVGLETDPSDIPAAGTATYRGSGEIEAFSRSARFDRDETQSILYTGESEFNADFGSGRVSGSLSLDERTERRTQTGFQDTMDISGDGGQIIMQETDIVENGFESDIDANAAGVDQFESDGIVTDDLEAGAVGRFYGNDADGIGAVIGGEGSSHVLTGVVTGTRQP